MKLEEIKKLVYKCEKCDLHKTKINYVFGEGNSKAKIIFIGEAPGANEDKIGKPFIGRAGKIFDELLQSINLKREDIYIANILKCRPQKNRNPTPDEISLCTPFLTAQIESIKPEIICPMGNFAAGFILKQFGLGNKVEGISKIHGKKFKVKNLFDEVILIPLYHPAVATYNPDMKTVLLEDIKILREK